MDFFENNNPFFNDNNIDKNDNFSNNGNFHKYSSLNVDRDNLDKIQITKRVKSVRQLKNSEKELVRLCYKQFSIKNLGSDLKDMQIYIAFKSKIWIERSGLEYLKKSEEQENREWFYKLGKDHFEYIYMYKKSIDKLDQLEKQLWEIFEDSKTTQMGKVKTIRELHKLVITSTMLLRDLPFVTKLSKFYDQDILDSYYNNMAQSKNEYSNRKNQEIVRDSTQAKDLNKPEKLDNSFDSNGIPEGKTLADERSLNAENKPQIKHKRLDIDVIEDMQRQMHITDPLKGKSNREITQEDLDKVITPEHKESIKRLREILDD